MQISRFALRLARGALRRIDVRLTRLAEPLPIAPELKQHTIRAEEIEAFLQELALKSDAPSREYIQTHLRRLVQTLMLVPPPNGAASALELGAYMQMTPALNLVCGYRDVQGASYGLLGREVEKSVSLDRGRFTCTIKLFDAERDRFPYPDESFLLVLCCEMLEHLLADPMHLLLEIRRVLKPGGTLLLTTPNCASLTSLACILHGRRNPQVYGCYPRSTTEERPHVREYTAYEIGQLMTAAGLRVELLTTERIEGSDENNWIRDILRRNGLDESMRGEQTYCLASKVSGLPIDRYPSWLYQ